MDPNANLAEQLAIADRIANDHPNPGDAERLAELSLALDSWIRAGGFVPERWHRYVRPTSEDIVDAAISALGVLNDYHRAYGLRLPLDAGQLRERANGIAQAILALYEV